MSTVAASALRKVGAARRRAGEPTLVYRLLLGSALVALWQFASGRWIDPFWISSPLDVGARLVDAFASGMILPHLYVTLLETTIGFVAGSLLGIATGFALAQFRAVARVLDPFIMGFNGIPRLALAPLIILWFGIGLVSKIVLVVLMVFFITFFNTYSGAQEVNPDLTQMMHILGASRRQTLLKIVLPSTLPWIVAALRLSVPYALVGAVVGEFIASSKGLGYLIQLYSGYFDTSGTLAMILVLLFIVLIGNAIAVWFERRMLVWRPANQASSGGAL